MIAGALAAIPQGVYRAEDFLDDDGITNQPQRIAVTIRIRRRRADVDFTGSGPQCAGSVNADAAITQSAVFYVFRCLLDEQVPATSCLMSPIRSPRGSKSSNTYTPFGCIDMRCAARPEAAEVFVAETESSAKSNCFPAHRLQCSRIEEKSPPTACPEVRRER